MWAGKEDTMAIVRLIDTSWVKFMCNFCGKVFVRKNLLHGEIRCPKCREYDVEAI